VILPDINLLLYAHIHAFPEHGRSRRWWNDVMNGDEAVGLAEAVVPLSVSDALTCAGGWIALACTLLRRLGTAGNLTTDAQLAALAIHHRATVHSRDTDVGRFPGLSWHNPLED